MLLSSLLFGAALGAEPPSVDDPTPSGKRSWRDAMVVIGVEHYENLDATPYAIADAEAMERWLTKVRGPSTRRMFTVYNPDTQEMDTALKRGIARARNRGTLWIYYSGQGWIGDDGVVRLLPADVAPNGLDGAMALADIESMAARSRAQKVVIIVDATFDGTNREEGVIAKDLSNTEWESGDNDHVVVWMADRAGSAEVFGPAEHGLFTWAVMGALQGWADTDGDGVVKLWEAQEYVADITPRLGREQVSTVDQRNGPRNWGLSIGELRDDALTAEQITLLSVEDRDRRMQLAIIDHEAQAVEAMLDAMALIEGGDSRGPALLESFVDEWQNRPITLRWVPPVPAVDEARALLENPDALKPSAPVADATDTGDTGDTGTTVEPVQTGPKLSDDTCDDLIAMEPDALMGVFSPGRIACVEERMTGESQTTQDKLSRLLLADADSKGEKDEWERLMARHLEDIDRSDPDMCFLYAQHLQKKGVGSGEEAIRFADYALENKQYWSGDTYKKRLYGLYRLRAEAANELWKDAEQNLIADPTDENDLQTQKWRGISKDYSREWLDYAQASEQNIDRALMICVSAAGTKRACEEK
ncbi:MAG: caspase family protein [Proteobacteria bacterium]|nr:caspase family protein [Pseudomonadota bacterium]MCP4915895.1 caspase family protein [Pseudomonadota bacterium]